MVKSNRRSLNKVVESGDTIHVYDINANNMRVSTKKKLPKIFFHIVDMRRISSWCGLRFESLHESAKRRAEPLSKTSHSLIVEEEGGEKGQRVCEKSAETMGHGWESTFKSSSEKVSLH